MFKKLVKMNSPFKLFSSIVIFSLVSANVNASRILAVFPFPSASHSAVLHTVTVELAKRGHELVVFTGYRAGNVIEKLPNYREIYLEENTKHMQALSSNVFKETHFLLLMWEVHKLMKNMGETTLQHPEMERLISPSNKENFDLIMIEWIAWDALNALGYRFNAPVIGLLSAPLNIFGGGGVGLGLPFTMIDRPNYMEDIEGDKNFIQRLTDLAMEIGMAGMHYYAFRGQQELVEKYFGENYPHVQNLVKNASMIFGTQDDAMPYPTITAPNIINMGGIHVAHKKEPGLPKDIRDFIEGGKEGVIYFSLGSTIKGIQTSEEVRNIFLQTFAELPYRVLWKWENDTLPGKPKNVFISKWMPQRAILAHPSIKVYVYQGGLQSTEEAMSAGVPLVGIPIFGDQPWNVNKMVSVGAAVKLNMRNLTVEKLKVAILEVINNDKYKRNIIKFRDLVNDRPYDPLENTMWWIEYVIRHKGAHHLRIARIHLPWYQSNHIDTLGFIFFVTLLLLFVIYKIIKLLVCRCFLRQKKITKRQKLKHS